VLAIVYWLIAITRRSPDDHAVATIVSPHADELIRAGDTLALVASNKQLAALELLLAAD